MSTLAPDHEPATQQPRSRLSWVLLGALAVTQLFAFWLLCSHQVRRAEARHDQEVVQQMALEDCLQYIPGSTIASCSSRADVNVQPAGATGRDPSTTGAVPVSFSYR